MRGDSSIYTDLGGVEHVAIVTQEHTDGSVDLAVLKTSLRNIVRSAQPKLGQFFDPNFVDPVAPPAEAAVDAPPPSGLSSVPQEEEFEQPVENPAHGDPESVA